MVPLWKSIFIFILIVVPTKYVHSQAASCPSFVNSTSTFTGIAKCASYRLLFFSPEIGPTECENAAGGIRFSLEGTNPNVRVGIYNITEGCPYYCMLDIDDYTKSKLDTKGFNFTQTECGDAAQAGLGEAVVVVLTNAAITAAPAFIVVGGVILVACLTIYFFGLHVGPCSSALKPPPPPPQPAPISSPADPPTDGCIADHHLAMTSRGYRIPIVELSMGDVVLTGSGYQEYIGMIHNAVTSDTVVISTINNRTIEVTKDHIVKTANGFVQAKSVAVGNLLAGTNGALYSIVSISRNVTRVVSPFTRSGTIVIDDVILSCFATVWPHVVANAAFLPVRAGIVRNVSSYFSGMMYMHNMMPRFVKSYVAGN